LPPSGAPSPEGRHRLVAGIWHGPLLDRWWKRCLFLMVAVILVAVVWIGMSAGNEVVTSSFEAEAMVLPPPDVNRPSDATGLLALNSVETITDGGASGGKALRIRRGFANVKMAFNSTISSERLEIRARAELCRGGPRMKASIDDIPLPPVRVTSTTWREYSIPVQELSGGHLVDISMDDDLALTADCDRNLVLDRLRFYG
jgi:hypothetical protein